MNNQAPKGGPCQTELEPILGLLSRHLPQDEAETVAHAIVDIGHSFIRIYNEMLPDLLRMPTASNQQINDLLGDIRDELRHVDYHIHDGFLKE